MNKILLPPVSAGYSTEEGFDIISASSQKGGKPRIRAGIGESAKLVNVTWECNREWYQYLRSAYRVLARDGLPPFIIDLPLDDSQVRPHIARIIPGTFKLSNINGHAFRVTARLSVLPNPKIVLVYTSNPYPYEATEQLRLSLAVPISGRSLKQLDEHLSILNAVPVSGELLSTLQVYVHSVAEELDLLLAVPTSGTLQTVLLTYDHNADEELDLLLAVPMSGTLQVVLVSYSHPDTEDLAINCAIPISGTLV